ncbi:hypothetical protein NX059_005198 [Plenodomus lindquistii]|nr:hypothetical protein NX059_005198 [Plenodomus lindquistii]
MAAPSQPAYNNYTNSQAYSYQGYSLAPQQPQYAQQQQQQPQPKYVLPGGNWPPQYAPLPQSAYGPPPQQYFGPLHAQQQHAPQPGYGGLSRQQYPPTSGYGVPSHQHAAPPQPYAYAPPPPYAPPPYAQPPTNVAPRPTYAPQPPSYQTLPVGQARPDVAAGAGVGPSPTMMPVTHPSDSASWQESSAADWMNVPQAALSFPSVPAARPQLQEFSRAEGLTSPSGLRFMQPEARPVPEYPACVRHIRLNKAGDGPAYDESLSRRQDWYLLQGRELPDEFLDATTTDETGLTRGGLRPNGDLMRKYEGKMPWRRHIPAVDLNDCVRFRRDEINGGPSKDAQGRWNRRDPKIAPSRLHMNDDEDQMVCHFTYFTHRLCPYQAGGCPANHNFTQEQMIWLVKERSLNLAYANTMIKSSKLPRPPSDMNYECKNMQVFDSIPPGPPPVGDLSQEDIQSFYECFSIDPPARW